MDSLINRVAKASRATKRSILIVYDVVAMVVALWAAFSVRLGESYLPEGARVSAATAFSIAVGILALYKVGIYRMVLRYFDLRTVSRIFFGAVAAAMAWSLAIYFMQPRMTVDGVAIAAPRSVAFIYCGFLFVLLFMGRHLMAAVLSTLGPAPRPSNDSRRHNIAIYGANPVGINLAESVRRNPSYQLHAFVDDEPTLHGGVLAGIPIYPPERLRSLVREHSIDEVFLAIPNATRSERLGAIARLDELKLKVKTVPAPEEIVSGRFTISDVRPIDVNDLLRRDPVPPLTDLIKSAVDDHVIMITGAGGSIGSEICRQIVWGSPRRLVVLDHSEFALYSIDQQLKELGRRRSVEGFPEIIPIVGSVLNQQLVRRTLDEYQVDTVYHAAAYKHVPLLEHNEIIGVENNVLGTLNVARAAKEGGVKRLTLISTDKAVRPQSVMGASKRIAELLIQACASDANCQTRFGIVRFGNVLDSSGSVIQKFRQQISDGGPLTVTHEDVTRYFMSIPEATQLVLQASAMASDGEVFVLDMGDPVKIIDLARQMVRLAGMTVRDKENPKGDIEIVFVGLRPGEKISEELFVSTDTLPTSHPRIRMERNRCVTVPQISSHVKQLESAIATANAALVRRIIQDIIEADGASENVMRLRVVPH